MKKHLKSFVKKISKKPNIHASNFDIMTHARYINNRYKNMMKNLANTENQIAPLETNAFTEHAKKAFRKHKDAMDKLK